MSCPHCHQPLPDPAAAICPHCGQSLTSAANPDALAGPTVLQGASGSADETPTVLQGAPAGEPERPAWNQPPGDDEDPTRPAWNQPLADSADTVAYTPPSDTPPVAAPPAYTPPTEQPPELSPAADQLPETVAYTPPTPPTPPTPQPPAYAPPAQPAPPAYTPPVEGPPAYTPPAYNQPPTPAYGPPQQHAYGTPTAQPGYQTGYPAATGQQPWTGQVQTPPQQKKSRAGCIVGCLVALVLVVGVAAAGVFVLRGQVNGLSVAGITLGGTNTGPGGGTLIYQDALDGSTKSQWTDDSNCFFGSGGYHINAGFICYAPSDKVGDAVTTVSTKQISGPITYFYGMVVRRVSKGNYYEFQVDANGKWRFGKVVNGTSTDIVGQSASTAIKTGLNQVNTLAVQAQGSHFVFSVNGTQVGTADDSTFTSGDTGLIGNDGIEVVFSSLSIANVKK
ncbi:MAG TPA: hypothetical protein VJO13_00600 [Ktedonobacterales bacterium]|nr:hypothetical protein [Ktedonobacterales bacterium]